jgi:hypothetical protein
MMKETEVTRKKDEGETKCGEKKHGVGGDSLTSTPVREGKS